MIHHLIRLRFERSEHKKSQCGKVFDNSLDWKFKFDRKFLNKYTYDAKVKILKIFSKWVIKFGIQTLIDFIIKRIILKANHKKKFIFRKLKLNFWIKILIKVVLLQT